jgi:hypothetical protein
MTKIEALKIIGNSPVWAIKNMARALSLHSWHNTRAEWQRLEAACVVLGRATPQRARDILNTYKQEQP